jgi:hypothetical protein
MDSSTGSERVYVSLKHFREVLDKWMEEHKGVLHPTTSLLEECGLSMLRLKDGGKNLLLNVVDSKKYLMAKLKYNF